MADDEAGLKADANKGLDQIKEMLAGAIKGIGVEAAVIYNNTKENVTFYVYNYIDVAYLISAQKTLVAPAHYGRVAASGAEFKIHPNDNKDHQFLVRPGKAYVYSGPGMVEEAK
jgi:hypothetical protein